MLEVACCVDNWKIYEYGNGESLNACWSCIGIYLEGTKDGYERHAFLEFLLFIPRTASEHLLDDVLLEI